MSGHQKTQQNARPQKSDRVSKPEKQTGQKVDPQQMLEAPETMRPEDILAAQQALGNQVVQRAVDKDPKRESATDEQGNLLPELSDAINQSRGGGSPLPGDVQSEAKKSLGRSFKDVRLHTDEQADQISRRISARAFTIGKDIFFKKGAYAPGSSQGRETLIHELTHVVQQSGGKGSSGTLKLGDPGSAMEQQADKLGKKAVQGVTKSSTAQVQRMPSEEEELQMQSEEEEELQMQGEEEELQMQPEEEEELQMQGEEEEEMLQMQQVEEEELQMQPDTAIVQRKWVQDGDEWKKVDDKEDAPKRSSKAGSKAAVKAGKMLGDEAPLSLPGLDRKQKKAVNETGKKKYETNTALLKEVGSGGKKTDMSKIDKVEKDRQDKLDELKPGIKAEKEAVSNKKTEENEKFEKTIPGQRLKLMKTLKDPNAKPDEIKKAKEKLSTLHKGAFSEKDFKAAGAERSKALEEAAQRGDDKAYEQMQSEKATEQAEKEKNPSKAKKFGGFMKKAGLGLAKGIGGIIADQGKDGLKHFLGVDTGKDDDDDDEKEEKKDKKGGKPAKGGGGDGGSAVGTIMEKYAEVVEENKKLKAMLEKKGA
jgi:hypothetical protein